MEKVKLTQEQAEIIEKMEGIQKPFFVSMHARGVLAFDELKELSLDELIKALYIGYEVEPEFEVGDWVYDMHHNKVARIDHRGVDDDRVWVDDDELNFFSIVDIRHATQDEIQQEKERRWWKLHGRNPWELKERDVLTYKESDRTFNVDSVNGDTVVLENIKYELKQIKQVFRVACFAENRMDVSAE